MKFPLIVKFVETLCFFSSAGGKTVAESKCPELLANFCDMLLRKSLFSKKLTSDEIEAKLKDVVSLCFNLNVVCYAGRVEIQIEI